MSTDGKRSGTVNVHRTEVLRSGQRDGQPWTLYQVFGTDEKGQPLERCKSFDALPVGDVQATLTPDTRDPSWLLLKAPSARKPRTERPHGGDAAATIARLESRVERLERQMRAIIDNAEVQLP